MITGALKSQVDRVWDAFWSGGIANPLTVIEQITYLLFAKRLDELHTVRERKSNRLGKPIEDPVLGFKPLLVETSTQAQFLIPLVASLAFGLLSATVLSLFLIPACFVIFDEMGWFKGAGTLMAA